MCIHDLDAFYLNLKSGFRSVDLKFWTKGWHAENWILWNRMHQMSGNDFE